MRPQDLSSSDRRSVYDSINYDVDNNSMLSGNVYDTSRTEKTYTVKDHHPAEYNTLPGTTTFRRGEPKRTYLHEQEEEEVPRRGAGKRVTRNTQRSSSPMYGSRSPNLRTQAL